MINLNTDFTSAKGKWLDIHNYLLSLEISITENDLILIDNLHALLQGKSLVTNTTVNSVDSVTAEVPIKNQTVPEVAVESVTEVPTSNQTAPEVAVDSSTPS